MAIINKLNVQLTIAWYVMIVVLFINLAVISLCISLFIQIFITNNYIVNLTVLLVFWAIVYSLMDFSVLIALNAKKSNYFKKFNLKNLFKLSRIKNVKIFVTEMYPKEIFLMQGFGKKKIIVFGSDTISLLNEQEFNSVLIYYLTIAKKSGFSIRTFIVGLNFLIFCIVNKIGKPFFYFFDFYYSQLFNIIQLFPLRLSKDKEAMVAVLSFEGTSAMLRSGFSKIFLDQDKKQDFKERILFPLISKSDAPEIIIDNIRLKINESYNQ